MLTRPRKNTERQTLRQSSSLRFVVAAAVTVTVDSDGAVAVTEGVDAAAVLVKL